MPATVTHFTQIDNVPLLDQPSDKFWNRDENTGIAFTIEYIPEAGRAYWRMWWQFPDGEMLTNIYSTKQAAQNIMRRIISRRG